MKKKKKTSLKEVQHFLYFYEKNEKTIARDSLKFKSNDQTKKINPEIR